MWSILPKKKPTFDLELEGPTALDISNQQSAERHAVSAEHARRLKPLNERLSGLPHTSPGNIEAELKRQIQEEKDRHKVAAEELSDRHRKVNEARAQRLSDALTIFIVPQMLGWLQDGETHWLERLRDYHPKLKEAVRYMVGHEMPGTVYTYRLAEAMLLKNGQAKVSDFSRGLANVSTHDLMAAFEAGDTVKIADALHVMERVLRDVNRGQAPVENATHAWRRRLICDFMEF